MRKKLAILLISIHFVGNTEAGQLCNIPFLVRHYQQHKQENPALGFIQFITMHYTCGGYDGTHKDDAQDQKLPFHNLRQSTTGHVFSPMVKVVYTEHEFFEFQSGIYNTYFHRPIPDLPGTVILQPPRI